MAEAAESNRKWIQKMRGDTCVIFVHGILSSGEECWRHEKGAYWPELLAQEEGLEDIGILVFSYRSDIFCHNYSVGDVVGSLGEILRLENLLDSGRIIFVCHSMGGIVVRRFLVKEQTYLIPRKIEFGVFLIASPSLGSRDANALSMLARIVGNSQAEALRFKQNNQWLNDLDNDFMELKEAGILEIKGRELVEDEPIKIKKWLGLSTQLVEPFAAARYFARPLKIGWSDHSSIAKPANARALQHEVLCKFIKEMLHRKLSPASQGIGPEEIAGAIQLFQEMEKKLNDLKQERHYTALIKVHEALQRTRIYIERRGNGRKRDADAENELTELWEDVGNEFLPFDQKLADQCFVKGRAWAEEIIWNDPKFKNLSVRLNGVLERIIHGIQKEREGRVLRENLLPASPVVTHLESYPSTLQVNIYDGTRLPLTSGTDVLYRIIDGNQKQLFVQDKKTSSLSFKLPFYDNFGDNYTVIVSAEGYRQVGFTPLRLSSSLEVSIDLMLMPENGQPNFSMARWNAIKVYLPFLASGVDEAVGKAHYKNLMRNKPIRLAALLNVSVMLRQIRLSVGTPVDYLKRFIWDDVFNQGRFFAYCDKELINQVRIAALRGEFVPIMTESFFLTGATACWKEIQFGESNVQLTFHEGTQKTIDGVLCVLVELDIYYHKDPRAHTLLEASPSPLGGGLADAKTIYALRWMAGRHSGVPEFNPPYTIE